MVVCYPRDAQRWHPWPIGHGPVIVVIFVLVVGITYTSDQVAAMASLLAAIMAAITPQPRWAVIILRA